MFICHQTAESPEQVSEFRRFDIKTYTGLSSDGAASLCICWIHFLNNASVLPSSKRLFLKNKFCWAKYTKCLETFWKKGAYSTVNYVVCFKNHCWYSWNWYMPLFLEENCILWSVLKGELDRIILLIFQYLDGPN